MPKGLGLASGSICGSICGLLGGLTRIIKPNMRLIVRIGCVRHTGKAQLRLVNIGFARYDISRIARGKDQ